MAMMVVSPKSWYPMRVDLAAGTPSYVRPPPTATSPLATTPIVSPPHLPIPADLGPTARASGRALPSICEGSPLSRNVFQSCGTASAKRNDTRAART
eukprot:scaffold9301_cov30-Tisochrysis_lutea.AAC.9